MRKLATVLCFAALVLLPGGCSKKVSEENAHKVKLGMTRAEVEALIGSGRDAGGDQSEWTTEKGKLKVGYTDNKVSLIDYRGSAPWVRTDDDKAEEKAQIDALRAEHKKARERMAEDQDRNDEISLVYMLLTRVQSGDRLPANEAEVAALPVTNVYTKTMTALRSGRVVVRWGALRADAVWAYEKDAPTKGGYVVGEGNYPTKKFTAEQLRPFVIR